MLLRVPHHPLLCFTRCRGRRLLTLCVAQVRPECGALYIRFCHGHDANPPPHPEGVPERTLLPSSAFHLHALPHIHPPGASLLSACIFFVVVLLRTRCCCVAAAGLLLADSIYPSRCRMLSTMWWRCWTLGRSSGTTPSTPPPANTLSLPGRCSNEIMPQPRSNFLVCKYICT